MTYFVPAVDGVAYGLLLFVVAAGLVLCFGVANILNLAHGTLYAVGAYVAAAVGGAAGGGAAGGGAAGGGYGTGHLALAVVAGAAAAAALGAVLAAALAPVAPGDHLAQALLTFGVALAGGGLLVAAFGPEDLPVAVPAWLDGPVGLAGHPYPAYRLALIAAAAGIAVGLHLLIARTRAGMLARAAADDPQMVACLGTSPARVRVGVLAGAGALAGAAGVLGAPLIGPGPGTGPTVLLLSLVVVVLGGLRSVGGTLLAALAVGQLQTVGVALLPAGAPFLLFAAMAVVLAIRSRAGLPTWRLA